MTGHIERYGAADLRRFLEAQGGERVDKGSGHIDYLMPNGASVPCPGHGAIVTTLMAARVAERLDMTKQELSAAVQSAPVAKHGKVRRGLARGAERTPARISRGDVLHQLSELEWSANAIRSTLKGVRDTAHYERLHRSLTASRRAVDEAAATAGVQR